MAEALPYHKEHDDLVLSLKFLNPNRDRIARVRTDFENRTDGEGRFASETNRFDPGNQIYALYAAYDHPKRIPEGWENEVPKEDLPLIDGVISTFLGVASRDWEAKEEPLNWYKRFNPPRISDAFSNVEWRQQVPVVGGEIVSELIRKHSLPNANHRTAIAFLRTYLNSIAQGSDPDLPAAGTYEGEWYTWAEGYVHESKRLLLLRRKTELLAHAKGVGFSEVTRKSGIRIDLHAHEFDKGNVGDRAERDHRELWVQFVEEVLDRSEMPELIKETDPGKGTFVERLR